VYDKGNSLKEIQPLGPKATDVVPEVSESVKRAAFYHGLGRLSYERVVSVIKKDMGDLAAALGKRNSIILPLNNINRYNYYQYIGIFRETRVLPWGPTRRG
jgi:hypothetical protein